MTPLVKRRNSNKRRRPFQRICSYLSPPTFDETTHQNPPILAHAYHENLPFLSYRSCLRCLVHAQ